MKLLDDIAPGVLGWRFDKPDAIYIPVIMAKNPGNFDVSRFLDSLPDDRVIKFPTVMNDRLRGMLVRRGFAPATEWAEEFGEFVEVYVRNPK